MRILTILGAILFANVATAQTLQIGLQDAEPGLVKKGSELSGYQVEIWNAIAADAGFKISFVIRENNQPLLAELEQGKIDALAGSTDTPDNRARFSLSTPIGPTAEAVVVPKTDTKQYQQISDAKGLTFATLRASVYANYLKQNGIAYKEFDNTTDALKAVSDGVVDASLFSGNISGYVLKQGLFPKLRVVTSYKPGLSRPLVMSFPKTPNENFAKTNRAIQKLLENGTIKAIFEKYGLN